MLAAAVPLLAPVAAQAATKTVQVGPFGKKAQGAFQKAGGDANAFFRKVVTIHAGDNVRWRFNGFHTVTFTPRGGKRESLINPDATHALTGVNDAGGSPFWFNGQPRLVLNPRIAFRQGGKTFGASQFENSGLPLGEGPPKPYQLTFKKAGTYSYVCSVHPGMGGTVRVLAKGKAVPTAAQDRHEAAREQTAVLKSTQRLSAGLGTTKLGSRTLQAGNDRKSGETVYAFFPAKATVPVNSTVTLQIAPGSTEDHTFTFGPSNGKDQYVDQVANNFIAPDTSGGSAGPPTLVIDPRAGYPSEDPKNGVPSYTAANHGNGFLNSGVLDSARGTPVPNAVKVRFAQPGTYSYICLIHPFMHGQITVTAP